ncbi:hypothetical protein SDC9_205348 [bioreactor metagenome]|uniref:Uncharacterized protein n=1 Tax=bioreactor metagenome TaxID=1076179 RepID=A0A645JB27_9ZZZZ
MKGVNIPNFRRITLFNNLQRFGITAANDRTAGLTTMEKLPFGDFFGLGSMGNKDNLNMLIFPADKLVQ